MAVLWSNPNPGPTPAELTHNFQVHGASIGEVLNSIIRQRLHDQQQVQSGIEDAGKGIAGFMQQRKADQVAQTLLDQASNYDNETPTDYESMARTLNEGDVGAGDAWKALQAQRASQIKESLAQSQIDQHKAVAGRYRQPASPTPMYDEAGSIIGYSSSSGAPHYLPNGAQDNSMDTELKKRFGATSQQLLDAAASGGVQSSGGDTMSPNDVLTVTLANGKKVKATRAAFAPYIEKAMGRALTADPSLSVGSVETGKAQGPPDPAISYLQAHPETAAQFDAKYGSGSAAQFLNP